MSIDDGLMASPAANHHDAETVASEVGGFGDAQLADRVATTLGELDLGDVIGDEVQATVRRAAARFARAALDEALTPERVRALQEQARQHVEQALSPQSLEESAPVDETPEPHFANVFVFVADFLVRVYAREGADRAGGSVRWCARWWEHPEAFSRLEALWQAFEALRTTPGFGSAHWWRDYADPTMSVLLGPDGPFAGCAPDKHRPPPALPLATPPADLVITDDAHTGRLP